jgi:spermidine synthase
MCEIDKRVVEVSKQFFGGSTATAFSDPRAEVLYMDAAVYMKGHAAEFDVIIVDSSDPVGPAETLYSSSFYRDMHTALRDGGVVCTQGECQFLHLELIRRVMEDARGVYPVVDYAYSCVPTYPDGQIGFIIATKTADPTTLRAPKRALTDDMRRSLRYYSEAIHAAAFVLPTFAAAKLEGVRAPQTAKSGLGVSATALITGAAAGLGVVAGLIILRRRR